MKIAIGADPFGFLLKESIKEYLIKEGHEIVDLGTLERDKPVLYFEASDNVAKAVQSGEAEKGIVFCGTGMGVSIVANKHKGIYCALVESQWAARECREINNANMLAMGGRIVASGMAIDIADTFLTTSWGENGDSARLERLKGFAEKIEELEDRNFK